MTADDWRGPWLEYQCAMGEQAYLLRQGGIGWRDIAVQLRLGDQHDARRCAALYLQTSRQAHAEAAGEAQ